MSLNDKLFGAKSFLKVFIVIEREIFLGDRELPIDSDEGDDGTLGDE